MKTSGLDCLLCEDIEDIRQPRPDSGLGFQVNILKTVLVVPSPLASGLDNSAREGGRQVAASDSQVMAPGDALVSGKVDARLPGNGNSNSHGARPVHLIIAMMKWIQTSRLSIKNSLSLCICRAAVFCYIL